MCRAGVPSAAEIAEEVAPQPPIRGSYLSVDAARSLLPIGGYTVLTAMPALVKKCGLYRLCHLPRAQLG